MKPGNFEYTLKQVANELRPTVSDALYKGMLKKQAAEKRKNKYLLFLLSSSLVVLCTIVAVASWINKQDINHSKVFVANRATNAKQTIAATTSSASMSTLARTNKTASKNQANNKLIETVKSTFNKGVNAKNDNALLTRAVSTKTDVLKTPTLEVIQQHNTLITNVPLVESQIAPTDSMLSKIDSNIAAQQILIKGDTLNIADNKMPPNDSLSQPQPILAVTVDTVANLLIKTTHKKWGILVSGMLQPIASVKNTAAHLPAKFYDSLELSPRGQLGVCMNISMEYQFTRQLSLLFGVGYQQVNFETIRAVDLSIDSTEMLAANNKFYAAHNTHFILDTRLSWIELPIQIQYKLNSQKRLSSYLQGGFVLQKLIAQKGIYLKQDDTLISIKNTELNRFSNLQMALLFEIGLHYRVSNHISLQLGVAYKQQLNNHYKNSYIKEQPGHFIGISPSIKFIF